MIKVENLTKKFGDFAALDNLSMHVEKGAIYGLVGVNGSGKTTLIRHLVGTMLPDEGICKINDTDVNDNIEIKENLGYIPDELFFFNNYSLKGMRDYYKKIYYYRFLYQTGQPILGQEWEEDIYRVVADIYIHNSRFTYLPYSSCNRKEKDFLSAQSRNHDEPNYIYPKNIDIPIQNQRSWNGMQKRKKHLIEVSTIRTMLLYAALAGIKEVQSFVTYANKVDNTFVP